MKNIWTLNLIQDFSFESLRVFRDSWLPQHNGFPTSSTQSLSTSCCKKGVKKSGRKVLVEESWLLCSKSRFNSLWFLINQFMNAMKFEYYLMIFFNSSKLRKQTYYWWNYFFGPIRNLLSQFGAADFFRYFTITNITLDSGIDVHYKKYTWKITSH